MTGAPAPGYQREPGMPASAVPAPLREIGFDQNLDRAGAARHASSATKRDGRCGSATTSAAKPVVLAFVYYDCPMLCTQVLNALTSTLGVLSLDAGQGLRDRRWSASIRARRRRWRRAKKAEYLAALRSARRRGRLALPDRRASRRSSALTRAAGFRYAWDEQTQQFAHPTGIIVLTPDGRLARYLFGIEYGPRDLRLALVEASDGKVGIAVDALLLYCYHYDPMTGRYGLVVMRALRIAGAATVLALGAFIFIMVRRETRTRRRRPRHADPRHRAPT